MTPYEALFVRGSISEPDQRELLIAAIDLAAARLELEEAEDAAKAGDELWKSLTRARNEAGDNGFLISGRLASGEESLRADVAYYGAQFLDAQRDLRAAAVAAAEAQVRLLQIRFGVGS